MISPDSSITTAAAAVSTMDDNSSDQRHLPSKSAATLHATSLLIPEEGDEIDAPNFQEGGDLAVWATFTENFQQVQSVLDRNRVLIQQVNENHQSKAPDNMVKNVALIQEINGNISKVVSLYSNLSANFSSVFNERSAAGDGAAKRNSEEKQ